MPRGPVCWPHQSTNTFCPVGAFVKEVLCTVAQLCPNLVEMIIIVLDNCDTSLESFSQVCFPQTSTNTLLCKARSCLFQLWCATQVRQWRSCGILISHLTQWTWPLVSCMPWTRACLGD